METLKVLTRKNLNDFKKDGGIGWWKISESRARKCDYILCFQNSTTEKMQQHPAFLIGKVSGLIPSESPGNHGQHRFLIRISEYAHLDTANFWSGARNPCSYVRSSELGIDFKNLTWHRFISDCDENAVTHDGRSSLEQIERDIDSIKNRPDIDITEKEALIHARIGQGQFREDVLNLWNKQCPITGCTIPGALRASHILSWADNRSNNQTRLDRQNGLLLSASVDALFDRYLISFADDGKLLFSTGIEEQLNALGIQNRSLGKLSEEQKRYMEFHRSKFKELSKFHESQQT